MAPMTRYDAHAVTTDGLVLMEQIKLMAEELARLYDGLAPSREASVALTHLQTSVMFGVRAVAVHPQYQRPDTA